jgi:DNA-binding winged helix-turn-helix (wHTH) protein
MKERSEPFFFEFEGLRLYPETQILVRLHDNQKYDLRKKVCEFLVALLRKPNALVSYEELRDQVWPDVRDVEAAKGRMRETKRSLDQLLGDITKRPRALIDTVSGKGYKLNGHVISSLDEAGSVSNSSTPTTIPAPLLVYKIPLAQILLASTAYGLMYVDALLLEIAFKWDNYGEKALWFSPLVFGWVSGTSITALLLDWRLTQQGKSSGLVLSIGIVALSAGVIYVSLLPFLPNGPITQTSLQASTAQAAYLKNVGLYFLPLTIAFLLIPFHAVSVLRREVRFGSCERIVDAFSQRKQMASGIGLLISVRLLGLVLLAAAITSLALTYRLFDHLEVSPYLNLFSILAIVRLLLYFGFGAECLVWYSLSLSDIQRQCDTTLNPRPIRREGSD